LNPDGSVTGPDLNKVSYNVADSKTATEKQQARDNIGLDTGIAQIVTTDAIISNLLRTKNIIIFEGGTAQRTFSGLTAGIRGERILIWNKRSFNINLVNDQLSTAANRFLLGANYLLQPNQKVGMIYDTDLSRWVFDQSGFDTFIQKNVNDFKQFKLDLWINGLTNSNRITFLENGGRSIIEGTRNGSYVPSIRFDTNVFYMGNDKGSAVIWGIHIDNDDKLHLGRQSNGSTSSIPTGFLIRSWLGHYFDSKISTLGINTRELLISDIGILDNVDIGNNTLVRFTFATEITGAIGEAGRVLKIYNNTGGNLTIKNNSGSSSTANRFDIGADFVIPDKTFKTFIYVLSRWRIEA